MAGFTQRHRDTTKRRRLRRDAPAAEKILWEELRNRRFRGYKFRRQHSVGCFVLDFYCHERRLAIEIDGPTHYSPADRAYDLERQAWIEAQGIQFIRFQNREIYQELDTVLLRLALCLDALAERPPSSGFLT